MSNRPRRPRPSGRRPQRAAPSSARRAPRTEAERRAAEVRKRRGPRPAADPDRERRKIEERSTEQWHDEGSIRSEALAATSRAAGVRPDRHRAAELDPEVVAEIHRAAGDQRRAAHLVDRLRAASVALDRERFDEARRIVAPVVREMPQLAAGHELAGLAAYRTGRWRQAATALEQAQLLSPDPALLPVLADAYRGLQRWSDVDRVWRRIREVSPAHDVMAEGRIVAAGALADRGELRQAISVMHAAAQKPPKKVREHHLRQWYVLADLLDRAGDPVGAARWFRQVLEHDPEFADTRHRLHALGR